MPNGDPFEGRPRYVDPFDPNGNEVPMLTASDGSQTIPVFDLKLARDMINQGWTFGGWRPDRARPNEGLPYASGTAGQREEYRLAQQEGRITAEGMIQPPGQGAQEVGAITGPTGVGATGWPSPALHEAETTGMVSQPAGQLPTVTGPEGTQAPPYLAPQSWGKLLPSEQQTYLSEIQNRGFPLEDYMSQWQGRLGGGGYASRGGPPTLGRMSFSPFGGGR